jgi:hypothetical protein
LRVANSAPPAQREAVNLISKIGPERALALLKAQLSSANPMFMGIS